MSDAMSDAAPGYTIRAAIPADAAVIAAHRVAMFRDMGRLDAGGAEAADALAGAVTGYLAGALASGEYAGWLALDARGPVVAGAGVQLRPVVPSPGPDGRVLTAPQAYLLNVYTAPAWRRRGVAEALVRRALAWAEARGCSSVALHASDAGRGLYERLGFRPTTEMRRYGAPQPIVRRPAPRRPNP